MPVSSVHKALQLASGRAIPAKLAWRRVGLVRLRTAVAVLGFLQRAEAGEFVKEHKTPRRCNEVGVVGRRTSLPRSHCESKNKSPLPARPRPTGLPPSSTPSGPTL